MMLITTDIYFSDLNEEAQKHLLELVKADNPRQMNWDIYPIAEVTLGGR